jgi:hypothetical protein
MVFSIFSIYSFFFIHSFSNHSEAYKNHTQKKIIVHENIFIGAWTDWLKPHVRTVKGHTNFRFFWFKKVGNQVHVFNKKNESDQWEGHPKSLDNSIGNQLFQSRPGSTNLLKSVRPKSLERSLLEGASKFFPWMDVSNRNWWINYLNKEVCFSTHLLVPTNLIDFSGFNTS